MSCKTRKASRRDNIGAATQLVGGYRLASYLGPLVDIGDRVQVRIPINGWSAYGDWGTVEKRRGLGRVTVRMDDGRALGFKTAQLQFEKFGRPPLVQAKAKAG